MPKASTESPGSTFPDAEQRFEQAIRRALATPPQHHKPTPKRSPKAKTGKRPR